MKLTIKNLSGKQFQLETSEQSTIADVKALIEKQEGSVAAVTNQKLIHSGKILQDSVTVLDAKIKETDFLVLMLTKPKTAKPSASAEESKPAISEKSESTKSEIPKPVSAANVPAPSQPNDGMLVGEPLQAAIANLIDMGFPRDEVVRAMRASFNNAERAVQYLTEGNIPVQNEGGATGSTNARTNVLDGTAASNDQDAVNTSTSGAAGALPGNANEALAALQDNPGAQQIMQVMRQNPEAFAEILQQFAQSNPQLLQAINQNPEALMQMLGALGGQFEGEGGEDGEGQGVQISLTEDEMNAITRLEALGFERDAVIEAYLACDRNEELAANYLFQQNE